MDNVHHGIINCNWFPGSALVGRFLSEAMPQLREGLQPDETEAPL